ncbi:uncharacterized protein LOC105923743 [Fundulus heteroclitus]|uniref:uncharacterized protein LOC105923743 n=1 Tax=Fundulus heteroclitus TaxID=8078 RepID=UPI00165C4F95|nr:uncharacterized protein LOC105923743 [Fundulus heteroclitus]
MYPSRDQKNQDDLYCGRTKLNEDLLRTGDVSLTLRFPTDRDSGTYICTVYRGEDILRWKVVLKHVRKEPFPSWAIVFLVFLLLFIASAGLSYHFRHYFMAVSQVVVNSEMKSVVLPCRTRPQLPKDVKVEWKDEYNRTVHVYKNGEDQPEGHERGSDQPEKRGSDHPEERGSDQPEGQDQFYKDRTKMNKNARITGDLSLTLEHPTDEDTNVYTCTVYGRGGEILKEKQVNLQVKVPQVVVDSFVDSLLLPCKITDDLPGGVKVEWTDSRDKKVHVFEDGSDQPEEQDQFYSNRTEMDKDPLTTKDFSLTLKYLTDGDSNIYTCTVYNSDEKILMIKQVELKVKAKTQDQPEDQSEDIPLLSRESTDPGPTR